MYIYIYHTNTIGTHGQRDRGNTKGGRRRDVDHTRTHSRDRYNLIRQTP